MEVRQIERYARLRGRRVLEIGCGDGRLTVQLARRASDVVAIDPDQPSIELARQEVDAERLRNVRFEVGFGEDVRPRGALFDVGIFSWSL